MATMAMPATKRSERAASTSAPPGICPISETKPAADRHEADIDLRPALRGEIDRDERPESGLHVGDEKNEPVETAQAAPRRRRRRFGSRRLSGGRGGIGSFGRAVRVRPVA